MYFLFRPFAPSLQVHVFAVSIFPIASAKIGARPILNYMGGGNSDCMFYFAHLRPPFKFTFLRCRYSHSVCQNWCKAHLEIYGRKKFVLYVLFRPFAPSLQVHFFAVSIIPIASAKIGARTGNAPFADK